MSNRPTASPQPPHHYHLHGQQQQLPQTLTAFQELIQDLTRDAQRAQPKDALQVSSPKRRQRPPYIDRAHSSH